MRGISLLLLVLLSGALQAQTPVQLFAWERPPLVQQTPDGLGHGLVVEQIDELFRRVGQPYQLSFLPLQRALVRAGREPNSCVLLVERHQEREPGYAWIGPLLISRLGLYAWVDDPLRLPSLEHARGLSILSHQGSAAGEYLRSVGLEVIVANKESLNLSMLQRGRARLWATSSAVVAAMADDPAPREVLPFLTLMEDIACHPQFDAALLQRLQEALLQMYVEGWVQALYRRHGIELY